METFSTPILLIIFNRPDTTFRVFEKVRLLKPAKLYIAADGPRANNVEDSENCRLARSVIEKIDWKCKVFKLFRTENLGCGKAVSSAINWFFEQEEEGIILEDDCLPDDTFFSFCQTLLSYYRNDERIMHIGGSNFQEGIRRGEGSYYFSAMVHVWGWATWKRAWKNYDFDLKDADDFIKQDKIGKYFSDETVKNYWHSIFKNMQLHKIDTWDYQWHFTVWNYGGLAIIPQHNLISNIGFGTEATHTKGESEWANQPTIPITHIIHPATVTQNAEADLFTFYSHYTSPAKQTKPRSILNRIATRIGLS